MRAESYTGTLKALFGEGTGRSRQEMRSIIYPKQYTEVDMKKNVRNIRKCWDYMHRRVGRPVDSSVTY